MLQSSFHPEGDLLRTPQNQKALADLAGLTDAMTDGRLIEAPAIRCDEYQNLTLALGGGREALLPRDEVQDTNPGEPLRDIAALTRVGKPVCVQILRIQTAPDGSVRVLVSRKAAQQRCRRDYLSHLRPGDIIEARVTHLERFGAFVDIGCGVISLLPIDCISVSRITHPGDRFRVGDRIPVAVRRIDPDDAATPGRIYVTHKELLGTWQENADRFRPGQTVPGVIRSIESYGIFVELTPNLAGLAECHPDAAVGQVASVYIKSLLPDRMKLKLALVDLFPADGVCPGRYPYPVPAADADHLERWQYAPPGAGKVVETIFDGTPKP